MSPAGSGKILFNGSEFPAGCNYPNGAVVNLQAVANAGYRFDRWVGNVANAASATTTITMNKNESVTAYFVLLAQSKTLSQVKELLNTSKDMIVLDVSSASDYGNSHMLCAKNYPFNNTTKTFEVSISNLSPYKNNEILVYDRYGVKSKAAADYLAGQGFSSIYYMTDGLDDWMAAGYDTFVTAEDGTICTSLLPLAYAGPDQTVNENSTVTLNGQGPAGSTYFWSQTQGPTVSFNPDAAKPTFTAPDLTSGNVELVFLLTVTNGGLKDSDSVIVNVIWTNQPPVANAGPDRTVKPGTLVTLDGSKSTDSETPNSLTYDWSVSAAAGVSMPPLTNPTSKTPTFVAPNKEGWIEFRLMVTDNGGKTSEDKVKITIQASSNDTTSPAAPTGLAATATSSSTVLLGWKDNSSNESGFKIERKEGGCGSTSPWQQVGTTEANARSFNASGLSPAKPYAFRVRATGPGGDSDYSNCDSVTTGIAGTPRSPYGLTALSSSPGQINLAWVDSANNETEFKIFRNIGAGWKSFASLKSNTVSYTDTAAAGNQTATTYQYYVVACNANGCSPRSNTAIVPFAPADLTAVGLSATGRIRLTWTDKSSNEGGFQIYRKKGSCTSAGQWELVATVGPNVASWVNSGLAPGDYSYRIRSFVRSRPPISYGYSVWTDCVSATSK